ncbi:MAG: carbohydrate ABC transporter substrate-binding protein, partial [Luteitalea sp.]|nr:carbohydrate ABC transporter substrate-binding protein [Luteitalea sp.]
MTWAHARGYAPLAATAQAFVDVRPDIDITWDRRSLAEFGEGHLEQLAEDYDLIVFDHPFTGLAAERHLFVPLDQYLDTDVVDQLKEASVGCSY